MFGTLTIYANEPDVFDPDEVQLLNELADDTGYGVSALRTRADRVAAQQRLRHGLAVTVEALASTVERRDAYTAGHQPPGVGDRDRHCPPDGPVRGGHQLASGWPASSTTLGKVQVPAEILSKPGRLTPLEFALIKEHAQAGYDIVKDIDFPWPVADIILQHHERLDGSGYPKGAQVRRNPDRGEDPGGGRHDRSHDVTPALSPGAWDRRCSCRDRSRQRHAARSDGRRCLHGPVPRRLQSSATAMQIAATQRQRTSRPARHRPSGRSPACPRS